MQGLELANQETATPVWFALRLAPATFGIFDAFRDEAGRQGHLNGPIAKASWRRHPTCSPRRRSSTRSDVIGAKLIAIGFCVRTVSDALGTPVEHRQLRTHIEEDCCGAK